MIAGTKNNMPKSLPPANRIAPTKGNNATDTNVKKSFISLWFLIKVLSLIAIHKDKHFSLRILIFFKKSFKKVYSAKGPERDRPNCFERYVLLLEQDSNPHCHPACLPITLSSFLVYRYCSNNLIPGSPANAISA